MPTGGACCWLCGERTCDGAGQSRRCLEELVVVVGSVDGGGVSLLPETCTVCKKPAERSVGGSHWAGGGWSLARRLRQNEVTWAGSVRSLWRTRGALTCCTERYGVSNVLQDTLLL